MKSPSKKARKVIDKPCKEGQQRNPNTNRCVYIKKSKVKKSPKKSKKVKILMEKQCKEGQEINPKTNRCVKKKSTKKLIRRSNGLQKIRLVRAVMRANPVRKRPPIFFQKILYHEANMKNGLGK